MCDRRHRGSSRSFGPDPAADGDGVRTFIKSEFTALVLDGCRRPSRDQETNLAFQRGDDGDLLIHSNQQLSFRGAADRETIREAEKSAVTLLGGRWSHGQTADSSTPLNPSLRGFNSARNDRVKYISKRHSCELCSFKAAHA